MKQDLTTQLKLLMHDWQCLTNWAEVYSVDLAGNQIWQDHKKLLDQRTEELGVNQLVKELGNRIFESLEEDEEK